MKRKKGKEKKRKENEGAFNDALLTNWKLKKHTKEKKKKSERERRRLLSDVIF